VQEKAKEDLRKQKNFFYNSKSPKKTVAEEDE
jgi:hypothetical protein